MICSSFNICQCSLSFYYFDSKTQTCNAQGSYLASCNIDYNCRVDLNLECVNSKCTCISSFPFWSIGFNKCIVPGNYSDTCFSASDCSTSKSLICGNGTSCSCPTNLLADKCDCPTRLSGSEMYWDGSICVSALSKNQSCSADYMCQTLTQATTCISGVCNCLSTEYFNNMNSKCESLLSINDTCTQSDACNRGNGLSCQFGVCKCNSTQFWQSSNCVNFFTYNSGSCNSNDQCLGLLICKQSGASCNCGINVGNNKCDCPVPTSGKEYYWNGTYCVNANSLNQPCTNNYECQSLTQSTTCSGTKCSCSSSQYFNNLNNKCESVLSIDDTCTQLDACNSGKGLSCVSTICQCNSTQFWKSSSSGCINFYSYNQGTCSSDNQCNNAKTNLICRISGTSCQCPTTVSNGLCDCPTRVANKELYWNGSSCVEAGDYGDTCTDWYQCKVLTNSYSLSCNACSSKCSCSDCFWNNITMNCDSCITEWTCHNSACFKGYVADKPFENTPISYITTNCKYGTSTKVNTLSTVSDWSGCNSGSATTLCSIANQVWPSIDMFFLGPVNSATCGTIADCSGATGTHDCSHGGGHHGMLCKYSLQ
jgi:hypothetical protein